MKSDTQHLDFLISQHVDGCLDATSKKSLEQRMVIDPAARELYREHREVQDLLDDWGNRIPMINWEEFDQSLARRLEKETVGGQAPSFWRRWGKITAVAASLLLAVGVGYAWRAMSAGNPQNMVKSIEGNPVLPSTNVTIAEDAATGASTRGSKRSFGVDEFPVQGLAAQNGVDIQAPADVAASELLVQTVNDSLLSVTRSASIATQPSSVTAERNNTHPEVPPLP